MAQFDFAKAEDLDISEEIVINMTDLGGGKFRVKAVHNLSRGLDDKVVSQVFEAIIDQVVDEQQAEFRRLIAPLYDNDQITGAQLNDLLGWIAEERARLEREAIAKKSGRPTGAQ